MIGTIEINGLKVYARHGVNPQERTVGNTFEVTVHLRYPIVEAMKRDHVTATLNYAQVIDLIKDVMNTPSALLENVAHRLHSNLMLHFPDIQGGIIRVAKLTPPVTAELDDVAIRIEW
ncbi:MAG: dihydroneopterin aldolase [Duncaniella sp.]|nr:dihydroneopterin aldolase [Duncaniella sp.]